MKFSKVRNVKTPVRAHPTDAGIDFFVPDDIGEIYLPPNTNVVIPFGIHVQVPKNYALIALNKSGIAAKKELIVGAQVVDETYQGELFIDIHNIGSEIQVIKPSMKLIQMLLIPVSHSEPVEVEFEELYNEETTRGSGGFGSSGI